MRRLARRLRRRARSLRHARHGEIPESDGAGDDDLLHIRLSNEAPEARQFTGSAHKIYLNGLYVGKGLSDEAITVPRLGTVTQDITVHLSNLALAARLKSVIEGKRFDYRIQSTFYGKRWWERLSSESEGKLDLKDFTPTEDATNAPPAEVRPGPPPVEPPAPPAVEAGTNSSPL